MSSPERDRTPPLLESKFSIALITHTYEKTTGKATKTTKKCLHSTKTKEITTTLSEGMDGYVKFMKDALKKHGENKLVSRVTEMTGYSFKYRLTKLYDKIDQDWALGLRTDVLFC
jgi:hypothetical protein